MRPEFEEELRALVAVTDDEIRLDDIKEVTDWSTALRGRFYRPRKKPISLRLDMDVLEWLKQQPGPYTTRINELCRNEMLETVLRENVPPGSIVEALLKLPEGRGLILEALEQRAGAGSDAAKSYRFALYSGKELVLEGESVDPAARAEVLAGGGLVFDRVVISGEWSQGRNEGSQGGHNEQSLPQRTG